MFTTKPTGEFNILRTYDRLLRQLILHNFDSHKHDNDLTINCLSLDPVHGLLVISFSYKIKFLKRTSIRVKQYITEISKYIKLVNKPDI